jgi:hypothetical protein
MIPQPDTSTRVSPVRRPVLLGLFAGTAVGVGYLLAGVPNVELMTLVISLAGAALGARSGAAAGALAASVYSLASPYGPPVPAMLVAQGLGLAAAGVGGHVAGSLVGPALAAGRRRWAVTVAAVTGLAVTLVYDLATNLAIIQAFGMTPMVVLTGAVPFALIHAGANTVIFSILFPLLLPRMSGLGRNALRGRSGGKALVVIAAALVLTGTPSGAQEPVPLEEGAPADSLVTDEAAEGNDAGPQVLPPPPPDPGPYDAFGWQRPLWTPFAPTALNWTDWYSGWLPVVDGGVGSQSVLMGEATTSRVPLVTRDGVPLGTGHVLADDPSLIPTQGLELESRGFGRDGWGGTDGYLVADTDDPRPDRAYSRYRGVKGRHESYFRGIHLLTPDAAWRAGFEFEESIDAEGYNFTELPDETWRAQEGVEFPGHGKVRSSRTRVIRNLGEGDRLQVEYSNARKTKDSLPALRAERMEVWDDAIAATMDARSGVWQTRTVLFWRNRDVGWGDRDSVGDPAKEYRLLETGREGVTFALHRATGDPDRRPLTGLRLKFEDWRVYDSAEGDVWPEEAVTDPEGKGQEGLALIHTGALLGPTRLVMDVGGQWDDRAGWGPETGLVWEQDADDPFWRVDLQYGGRHARSDELLTPLIHDVDGRRLVLLPNAGLDREKSLRAGALLNWRLIGFDLAVDGSWRHLTRGITWEAETPGADVGTWSNGLEMDSARVTGRLAREGRFLGWGRMMVEGTWRDFQEKAGRASLLPPEYDLRLHLMWENHFFQEDGIFQVALLSNRRGAMSDPWDVTRTFEIPARTLHDLVVGLRLVGVHLTLAFRNLTGDRVRLTSGALSPGQELNLRLNWGFHY